MKQEFKLLAAIIRDNTPESYDYEPDTGTASAKRSDYDHVDVLPVSDPNASTMAQRVIQYQAVMQMAQSAPQIYDLPYLHRQMIEVLGVKNAQKIIPSNEDMKPVDAVSENMALMNGKPVKAFLFQDHQAHIMVHMAAMQDPKLAQVMGQNPQAQSIMAAANAHVMEHLAFEYRKQIEQKLGVNLPPPPQAVLAGLDYNDMDTGYLPPEVEVQISQMSALAAQQLLQKNQSEAQQQQAQQQMQDPLVQMQMQELQIKQQQVQMDAQLKQAELQMKQQQFQMDMQIQQAELQRKSRKDVLDAAAKADDQELRRQESTARIQLDGAKMGADISKNEKDMNHRHEMDGVKLGVEISKHKQEMAQRDKQLGVDALKHTSSLTQESRHKAVDRADKASQPPPKKGGKKE
jgi:hypothetical protein